MPYKDLEKRRVNARRNYYKNREKKLKYQKEYDKKNKERKNAYEREKRRGKMYNKRKVLQHYAQRNIRPVLLLKYKVCQLKLEECLMDKKLQVHHKRYTNDIKDCLLVCLNCHKQIHRKHL